MLDASDICLESRQHPLCHVPEIGIGNKPIDGGHYLFTEKEKDEFVASEPASEKYFKKWLGAEEFLHNVPRYCLWLGDCEPEELKKMPECLKRVEAVRAYRLDSVSAPTRKLAEFPRRFHVENMPDSEYIAIPKTSSENRRYIPIGFLQPAILAGDALFIIPRASLYHFGILASSVHNCWMRTVAGRLKSDYRYSKDIVYNNFPWPEADEKQRMKIAKLSQQVLDARAKFPDSSLAALYDPRTMPAELVKAHQVLDRAVVRLYGWVARISESEMVGKLFELYAELLTLVEGKRCF